MYKLLYVYSSVNCYVLVDRNCSRVSKSALELCVDAATLWYFCLLFSCMFAGTAQESINCTMLSIFKCCAGQPLTV